MPDIDSPNTLPVGDNFVAEMEVPQLSAKHELFVEKYLETFNIKEAAQHVGITHKTASRWMREREDVKEYFNMRREQIAANMGIAQEWIIGNWIEMTNRGMGRVDGFEHDHGVALKATELLAKSLSMFNQTLDVNYNSSVKIENVRDLLELKRMLLAEKSRIIDNQPVLDVIHEPDVISD